MLFILKQCLQKTWSPFCKNSLLVRCVMLCDFVLQLLLTAMHHVDQQQLVVQTLYHPCPPSLPQQNTPTCKIGTFTLPAYPTLDTWYPTLPLQLSTPWTPMRLAFHCDSRGLHWATHGSIHMFNMGHITSMHWPTALCHARLLTRLRCRLVVCCCRCS